jgi:hypothetical protein
MHHQRIALTSSPLLQRQQLIWCLCRTLRNTTSRQCMRTMFFCHGGAERCLVEVKIAPTNPTFLAPIGHGVMLSHTAPSANHTRRLNHTNREFKPWTNWRYSFSARRVGWWRCEFLWRTQQKPMLLAIAGSRWETSWFEVEFQTQTSTKIPLESSHQGL